MNFFTGDVSVKAEDTEVDPLTLFSLKTFLPVALMFINIIIYILF